MHHDRNVEIEEGLGETGLIKQEMLARHLTVLQGPIYYIAGPPAMVAGLRKMLVTANIDEDDIRTEDFAVVGGGMAAEQKEESFEVNSMLTNRPKTKILVDGGDPNETLRIKSLLGFVDGQTTNPSLIARIPNAYIKYPCTHEGLRAAQMSVQKNIRVNMTLCFSQEQAAAVYAATKGSKQPVYVSPFVA